MKISLRDGALDPRLFAVLSLLDLAVYLVAGIDPHLNSVAAAVMVLAAIPLGWIVVHALYTGGADGKKELEGRRDIVMALELMTLFSVAVGIGLFPFREIYFSDVVVASLWTVKVVLFGEMFSMER